LFCFYHCFSIKTNASTSLSIICYGFVIQEKSREYLSEVIYSCMLLPGVSTGTNSSFMVINFLSGTVGLCLAVTKLLYLDQPLTSYVTYVATKAIKLCHTLSLLPKNTSTALGQDQGCILLSWIMKCIHGPKCFKQL
jgi:hypothetical protein